MAPRLTSRNQPTTAHRDDGRERLARLTGWIAAGGIAGVGIFSVVAATSAPAKTVPTTTVVTPSNGGDDVEQPATVPPTVPDTLPALSANDPSSGGAVATLPPIQVLQPPAQAPATSGKRHHQSAAATTGGS